MMAGASETNTALLVQVLEQMGEMREDIGKIKNQLEHGAKRFDGQDVTIAAVTTRVSTMETFMGKKMAPILAVSSAVIAAVLWIIMITAGAGYNYLKGFVGTHLHWS